MFVCNGNQAEIAAVILLAGDAPAADEVQLLRQLLARPDPPLLLAADGGADHLAALGLCPDLLLGDGDSLSASFPEVERIRFQVEKDFSDGEAALAYALAHCSGRVLLMGALGGRLDHLLFNVQMALGQADGPERVLLSGPGMEAAYSRGQARISGQPGDLLSLFPLGGPVKGICLQGLQYPLANYELQPGSSRTLSNVFQAAEVVVQHQEGILLLLHYRKSTAEEGGISMEEKKNLPKKEIVKAKKEKDGKSPAQAKDEERLKSMYPNIFRNGDKQSYYFIPDRQSLLRAIEGGFMLEDEQSSALLRLDMAISSLWPHLEFLFNQSVFSSRLFAAVELKIAAKYADDEDAVLVEQLAKELDAALDALEFFFAQRKPQLLALNVAEKQNK
ncbi:MAG: thiamine diphosphokinase, partial [Bacillota bacterium]|nr:thiamine diphosphokinase [Bacillota bacterium]